MLCDHCLLHPPARPPPPHTHRSDSHSNFETKRLTGWFCYLTHYFHALDCVAKLPHLTLFVCVLLPRAVQDILAKLLGPGVMTPAEPQCSNSVDSNSDSETATTTALTATESYGTAPSAAAGGAVGTPVGVANLEDASALTTIPAGSSGIDRLAGNGSSNVSTSIRKDRQQQELVVCLEHKAFQDIDLWG